MLENCPRNWIVNSYRDLIELHDTEGEYVGYIDTFKEEINPIRPLKTYVHDDGSVEPLGLMDEEEWRTHEFNPNRDEEDYDDWYRREVVGMTVDEQF